MVYKSVFDIYEQYDSFLIDVYGVLYDGRGLYNGALDLLQTIRSSGRKVIILSNITSVSRIAEKRYNNFGMFKGKHYDEFLTAGEVFNKYFETNEEFRGGSYYQIFTRNEEIFGNTGMHESNSIKMADVVYIGNVDVDGLSIDLNNIVDYENVPVDIDDLFNVDWGRLQCLSSIQNTLAECLKYKKKLYVANPDIFAIENGGPVLCAGGVAEYYERMGGEAMYFGKPYRLIYDYAKQHVSGNIVMIGDTPWTDVLGGNVAGVDTILTLTGVSELFIQRMPRNASVTDKMRKLLTDVSDKMTHKSLKEHSRIPTHIVKSFC